MESHIEEKSNSEPESNIESKSNSNEEALKEYKQESWELFSPVFQGKITNPQEALKNIFKFENRITAKDGEKSEYDLRVGGEMYDKLKIQDDIDNSILGIAEKYTPEEMIPIQDQLVEIVINRTKWLIKQDRREDHKIILGKDFYYEAKERMKRYDKVLNQESKEMIKVELKKFMTDRVKNLINQDRYANAFDLLSSEHFFFSSKENEEIDKEVLNYIMEKSEKLKKEKKYLESARIRVKAKVIKIFEDHFEKGL